MLVECECRIGLWIDYDDGMEGGTVRCCVSRIYA